jgi:transcriptional regulator
MYLPPHFEETDKAAIAQLIEAFPLGLLVLDTADGVIANHIPMMWDGETQLIGHIAKANDLHRITPPSTETLAIFQGGDSYISPNWYPTKKIHHKHVPTWNYQVVHIRGKIAFHHDTKTKTAVVGKLTKHFEIRTNGKDAWKMADAPRDFMADKLNDIVAFDIQISNITAKSKLSQNKDRVDFQNVGKQMERDGQSKLSEAMIKHGDGKQR